MLNILWHDIRISALFILLVVAVWLMGALSMLRHGDAYFWWCQAFVLALVGLPEGLRWQAGSDRLLHSLPVSRTDVVRGRVLAAVGFLAAAGVLSAALAAALAALSLAARGVWIPWVEPATAILFLAVAAPLVAIEMMAFHRWPAGWAAGVVAVVLMATVTSIQLLSPGVSGGALTGAGGMVDAARDLIARVGAAWVWAAAVGAAGVVLLFSSRVSERCERRREF